MSFLGLALAAFVVFLGLLGVLSVGITKSATSSGSAPRGCLGGCGLALALVFLCGLGVLGTGAFLATLVLGAAVEASPLRGIELARAAPADDGTRDPAAPVHLPFRVEGPAGSALAELVGRIGGVDPAAMNDVLTISRSAGADGTELWVYDFRLPLAERDLAALEAEIRRGLDELRARLPAADGIRFEGAEPAR